MRLALFDCDGTLVDSQHAIIAAVVAASRAAGVDVPSPEAVRRIVGLSLVEAMAALWPARGAALHERLAGYYREAFAEARRHSGTVEPLYPGIRDALERLAAAGVCLGVATGKSRRGLDVVLEFHGLRHLFETLQTADQGPGKPHPDMVYRALADVGADAIATAMIGDTTYDVTMARSAGVAAVGVAWGYHPSEALLEAGAHVIVAECAAVPAAVLDLIEGSAERGHGSSARSGVTD